MTSVQKQPKTPSFVGDFSTEIFPIKKTYEIGNKRPPKNRQFGQPDGNPRHRGAWKKDDTARYKLEQMLKLTETEIDQLARDSHTSLFVRELAYVMLLIRRDENYLSAWNTLSGMINQVYGMPKNQPQQLEIEHKSDQTAELTQFLKQLAKPG